MIWFERIWRSSRWFGGVDVGDVIMPVTVDILVVTVVVIVVFDETEWARMGWRSSQGPRAALVG